MNTQHLLNRNINIYPYYMFLRNCYFWGPAFFLYFTSVLTLSQTLWLEAVYYVSVAVIEVPSGYLSDRFGRKGVLMLSSAALSTAYLLFFLGSSFTTFAVAQLFMATGFAFSSGTDTALHYESLDGLNRQDEYGRLEARALRFSFIAGAVGAVIGGGIAVYHLKWIYGASFLAALSSLILVWRMVEPETSEKSGHLYSMGRQIFGSFKKAWNERFRFFTVYTLAMTVLLHFPYEFYQPYLEKVTQMTGTPSQATPGLTGIHLAATMMIGSWFTRFGKGSRHRCRVKRILIGCAVFQLLLMGSMALVVHPVVVVLLLARTVSKAISTPLVNAEVAPLLEQSERSTYLSLQSLLGRVSYGIILLVLPFGASFFSDSLHGTLVTAVITGSLLVLCVSLTHFHRDASQHCCSDHKHLQGAHHH